MLELLEELDDVECDILGKRFSRPTPKGSTTESFEDTAMKILLKNATVSLTLRLSAFSKITVGVSGSNLESGLQIDFTLNLIH